MSGLLTFHYWFNYAYIPFVPWFRIFIFSFTGLMILGIVVFAILKKKKSLYTGFFKSLFSLSVANAIVGLLVSFFVFEEVPFFSARIWILLWAVEIVWWLVIIFKRLVKLPELKKEWEKEEKFNKYLPR